MSVFPIALVDPDKSAWRKLRDEWPNRHYVLSSRMAFVAPEGISTAQDIGDLVGISTEAEAPAGIVVPLDSHSGVLQSGAVDWIKAADNG